MMTWLANQSKPVRIVDPGAGSGRFILAAGQAFPDAQLVAIENGPAVRAHVARQPDVFAVGSIARR